MTKIEYQNKKCHLNYPMRNNSKNLLSSPQFQDDFWHWVLTQLITTFIPNLPSRFLLFHDWGCKFCHPSGKLVVFNVMFNSHAKKNMTFGRWSSNSFAAWIYSYHFGWLPTSTQTWRNPKKRALLHQCRCQDFIKGFRLRTSTTCPIAFGPWLVLASNLSLYLGPISKGAFWETRPRCIDISDISFCFRSMLRF